MSRLAPKTYCGTMIKPRLSLNFGTRLYEKELELERNCTVEVIDQLVQLYTEAIEYYEYIHNEKYYDIQQRMHKMFLRPDVIKAIKSKNQSTENSKPTEERSKSPASAPVITEKNAPNGNANRIMDHQKSRNKEAVKKATKDLESQDKDLDSRLASRQKVMLTKSSGGGSFFNRSGIRNKTPNQDYVGEIKPTDRSVSPFFNFSQLIEDDIDLGDDLEKIMEQNFLEKAKKIAEIRVKYESQFNDISGEGPLMEKIREKLMLDMEESLNAINKEFDDIRKDEIRKLKLSRRKETN